MAQTGYTPILIYSSSTTTNAPAVGNLTNSTLGSELAINITDGKLFYKDNANVIQVIGWKTVPATAGGTGQTSYAIGDILYANTTTSLAKLADVATGNALISGGVGVAPAWGKIGLTTHISGILPIANGGTNASSASITSFNNITGYSATGATGTTSTNLVFSTSPSITTPTLVGDVTLSTGNLVIGTSGKGIDFSATAGTGTSELLADYEEGTWTPSYLASGGSPTVTYDTTFTKGYYTKVGRLVTCNFSIKTNAVSGGGGLLIIGGLPFAAANVAQDGGVGSGNFFYVANFLLNHPQGFAPNIGFNYGYVTYQAGIAATGYVTVGELQTGTGMNISQGTLSYIV
jgi:hypothetical protein